MTDTKYMKRSDAIKKIKDVAEDISICMFCIQTEEIPFDTRPMGTRKVDDDGNIWFLSSDNFSEKIAHMHDDKVQLIYAKPSQTHFLSISGHAEVIKNSFRADESGEGLAKALLPEERKNPNLTFIRFTPEHANFWDTKSGKMLSLL
ncbi:MAG: pyridoxamine 5'-phosphate oxidase family protein [Bacteroidota bacterium]